MLNRRNLRIKAMQTLFAFKQARQSNRELAWEQLRARVWQDNGSAETQVADQLDEGALKEALHTAINDPQGAQWPQMPEHLSEAVVEMGNACMVQDGKDLQHLRKNMLLEVEGINNLFLWVLGLCLALAEYEQQRFSKKKMKGGEVTTYYFAGSRGIELLQTRLKGMSLPSWSPFGDRLSQWYKELLKYPDLEQLSQERKTGLEDEIKFIRQWYKSILWKSDSFQDFMEDRDMGWAENQAIIKSMINKTLKSITEEGVELAPLSYQWEDDRQFFEDIFDSTLEKERWAENLVSTHAKNWDTERIAQVDMVLLKMALTEMIKFPSIPVKVTINEYIELSKRYSTPKSKKFINGILDVLAHELVNDGTIKKSGRGLIDNK